MLHNFILPSGNCLPCNMYHANTYTTKVGHICKSIHACKKGFVLYKGMHKKTSIFLECGDGQYKRQGRTLVMWKLYGVSL